MNIQKLPASKCFFSIATMQLSLLGGRPKHLSTISDGIVLLSRYNALHRAQIGSFRLVQVSLCVFPSADVFRQRALRYLYSPFVPIWKVRFFRRRRCTPNERHDGKLRHYLLQCAKQESDFRLMKYARNLASLLECHAEDLRRYIHVFQTGICSPSKISPRGTLGQLFQYVTEQNGEEGRGFCQLNMKEDQMTYHWCKYWVN